MAISKLKFGLIMRIIGAVIAGAEELAHALEVDSDGGKKITPAEAKRIASAMAAKLEPIIEKELLREQA